MKFLDLFSGVGGFRLGLEKAGHECVGHCEIDKFANKSYIAMHEPKESEWFAEDITKVRADELPGADIWCFGFPYQDISVAGKQRGLEGTRSGLFYKVTDLIKSKKEEDKPSILFIENVKNLLSINGGWDFARVLIELDEIGYDAEWQVLNSKHFGVPQNRERVFIVGHLRGRGTRKIFPIGRTDKKTDIPIKQIAHRKGYFNNTRTFDPTGISGTLDTAGGGGRELHVALPSFIDLNINPKLTENARCLKARYDAGVTNRGADNSGVAIPVLTPDRVNKQQNGRRFKTDGEPMFTLTSQDRHGVIIIDDMYANREPREYTEYAPTLRADRQGLKVTDSFRIRKLTPKECFRLQGFPDEYFERARALNSDTQLYKQAGNSVTVNVIYEIARRF